MQPAPERAEETVNTDRVPNNNMAITLPSGRVIRFYEHVVLGDMERAESFSVHYDTTIPGTDHDARIKEAAEVVQYFSQSPSSSEAKRANASICSTPAQVSMCDFPQEIYMFELSEDKEWSFVGMADLPSRPPNTR